MGLRFRKSLRLFKGLTATASAAGVGLRAGVPGLTISVGPSGPALNLGVPGSGLGYRVPLGGGATRAEQRAWRAAVRAEEAAARAARMLADAEAHVAAEARLESLAGVLRGRWRAPFSLWEQVAPLPPFEARSFEAHPFVPTPAVHEGEAAQAHPIGGLLAALGALALIGFLLLGAGIASLAIAGACTGAASLVIALQHRRRRERVRGLLAAAEADHARREAERLAAHAADEDRRRADHATLDAARAALRTCLSHGNAAPIADLFEQLLASMDFPVPVVADVEFDDLSEAAITLELPDLDDVPDEKTSLTTRGRLSRRPMPKGERVALYEDLCCGIALRLVYELLRFVPTLRRVHLRGMATQVGSTGHDEAFVALVLDVDRATLEGFDLDRADPSTAAGLLGRWGGNKRGVLKAVE